MTSSDKSTLAARSFVRLAAINQLVAMLMMVLMLSGIQHIYQNDDHTYIVLWRLIDSRNGPSASTWVYITIRCLMLCHGIWLDFCHTSEFDKLKKDWDALAPGDQDYEKGQNDMAKESQYPWARLRTTVFSKWIELLPTVLVGIASVETLSRRLPKPGAITDWSQSAALVLAIAGGLHWVYVLKRAFDALLGQPTGTGTRLLLKYAVNYPRYHHDWDPPRRRLEQKAALERQERDSEGRTASSMAWSKCRCTGHGAKNRSSSRHHAKSSRSERDVLFGHGVKPEFHTGWS